MALDMWNGSVWVVTTVGTSPMCRVGGATRAAISTASRRPAPGRSGRRADVIVGLQVKRVLDGDEVEQPRSASLGQVHPVAGGEQLVGPGVGSRQAAGMPPGTVEGDRQVHGCLRSARAGHGPDDGSGPATAARAHPPLATITVG